MASKTTGAGAVAGPDLAQLKAKKGALEQKKRERERAREEGQRLREKEKELKEAEEQRRREDDEKRLKLIAEHREKAVETKLMLRERSSEYQARQIQEHKDKADGQRALRAISMVSLQNNILAISEKNQRDDKESYARMASMRKAFVALDKNGDGVVTPGDVRSRLSSYGCNVSKQASETLLAEVQLKFGVQARSGDREKEYWSWAIKMHQPKKGANPTASTVESEASSEFQSLGWSHKNESNTSNVVSMEASGEVPSVTFSGISDNLGAASKPEPAAAFTESVDQHRNEIHSWVKHARNRIVCPDAADCATKGDVQHPPVISPRMPLDRAPQDKKMENVCPVMLTEAGLMTEVDWKAHRKMTATPDAGITWVGFRDCYLEYMGSRGQEDPIQLLSIAEFLTRDTKGHGTASLADAMECLFTRFGMPSDALFTKLFGNSCDPHEQMELSLYLEKVEMLRQDRIETRRRTAQSRGSRRDGSRVGTARTPSGVGSRGGVSRGGAPSSAGH